MKLMRLKKVWGLSVLIGVMPFVPGFVCQQKGGFVLITPDQGFGDPFNKYSWSIAEKDGKIYVGTLNLDFRPIHFSDLPPLQGALDDPIAYWEDIEALIKTHGGEIWCYDPADGSWTKVHDMEGIEPSNIGFRNMINYQGRLFAGTLNIEGPAEIWTSENGTDWSLSLELSGQNQAVRGQAVVGDYLYAGTDNRDRGAQLWRFDGETWELFHVFEGVLMIGVLEEMDGMLYIGTWDIPGGFELYRYNGAEFELLVTKDMHSEYDAGIMAMHPFLGKMYMGTSNFIEGFGLYTYDPVTDEFEMAAPRGFWQPSNTYAWRLEVHGNRLFLGTFTSGNWNGGKAFDQGLQLWSTEDGEWWHIEVPDGFGDVENYGVRALLSAGGRLYVGTANNMFTGHGTQVWMREGFE
jgi:hypothetical protein